MKILGFMSGLTVLLILGGCGNSDKVGSKENPFFSDYTTKFGVPPFDLIKFEHYKPAFEEGMKVQAEEIKKIAENSEAPTFENTIVALDNSGELLQRVSAVFDNESEANTNDSIQALAQEIAPLLSKHSDDISLNPKLFERIKTIYDQRADLKLNAEQLKLVELTYLDFVRGGALLNAEDQKRFREINERMSVLELQFGDNIMADNNAFSLVIENKEDLAGLPQSVIDAAVVTAKEKKMDGKWVFTTDKPSMIPFLQYAEKRELREKIYKGYFMRGDNNNANDNKKIIAEIIALRLERAKLLGFENHASFVLDRNMAKTPAKVYELLEQIWKAALPVAKAELAEMQKIVDRENGNFKIAPWDWWFYSEKVRKEKFDLDEEMLRPYFKLENVRDGAFMVANKLYGISIKPLKDMPVYHKDVQVFEVLDKDNTHLAVLYMDFYPRPSKSGGAWCTSYRDQYVKDGKPVTPVVSIVCNFTPPDQNGVALLNIDEVLTLFHEFGHGLHGFFSDVTYQRLSGYVPRDFVELPSQIMEHWALNPQVLKMYAKHYKTGEVIPDELIAKIEKSSFFNQGFASVEFIAAAILDMDYHTMSDASNLDVTAFENESMSRIGLIAEILPRYRSTYFAHIFSGGYSSGYYSYIWSEVLDSDAFEAFEESGDLFNKELADKFRKEVLAPGGKSDALDMYVAFRGREPKIEALLRNRGLAK